ncbi:hypothetical protein PV08_07031 [Exophiala spinifera]|uniref:TRP C-terminal domain-containing protein n=1 Tax=Exophiala spinifera TaxID=91928 RepID=A0A0D2BSK2_9EURO|nr:uncharacterized protein PV08_07031 [Exophiala spinifera]KIW14249.1 hypothetical protein PV08_07031 [Exophiala spinifera]
MDIWLNMVIIILMIAIVGTLLVELSWPLIRRFHVADKGRGLTGIRNATCQVLRIILSYFLLPLVAISSYQFDFARILPAYHSTLAAGSIFVLLIAFAWLWRQLSTPTLGILILRSNTRDRSASPRKKEGAFVWVYFLLVIARGISIGALQISGTSQIVTLAIYEIIFLGCVGIWPELSGPLPIVCAVARLTTIALMTTFVPGVATYTGQTIVGYVLLGLHAMVMIMVFWLPTTCRVLMCFLPCNRTEQPPVYGLRELRQRILSPDSSATYFNAVRTQDTPDVAPSTGNPWSEKEAQRVKESQNTATSRFYRPPKSTRLHKPDSLASITDASNSKPDCRHLTEDLLPLHAGLYSVESARDANSNMSSWISGTESEPSEPSETSSQSLRGPRWNDYTFRESDLVFGTPQPPHQDIDAPSEDLDRYTGIFSAQYLWRRLFKRKTPTEKGFQVVRPAAPPIYPDSLPLVAER